ncbi:hypothetical protein V474_07820 [Novosphingobium barchaimii LL02]|uniref:Uncharacterized protein n=2 Tax=Novosphingobium barchaimii TaxID=1420591 RepID=A0A0J7Y7S6_9SPHN|nr:hypothetical protein V474_07820 [Novosphingobium barchaimii LL02]
MIMAWAPIDISTPEKWHRFKAWRWRDSCWIVAIAFCPTHFSIGAELLTGFGRGVALQIGPFWLGAAANFSSLKDPA